MSSQGQSYGASLYSEIGAILNDIIARPAIIVDPIQLMSQAIAGVGNTPTVSVSSGINLPIPIFPTDYKEIYPSSCSQQLIVNVNNGTKQYIVDNIAIGPRSWQITGYLCSAQAFLSALVGGVLPGIGTGQASLLTAIPALGAASQALGSVAQFLPAPFLPDLYLQKNYILAARQTRLPILFRPKNNVVGALMDTAFSIAGALSSGNKNSGYVSVAITNLEFPEYPDETNVLPITITVQEVQVVDSTGNVSSLNPPFSPAQSAGDTPTKPG